MAQWYAQIGGQRYGPVSEEELRSWIAQGKVKPTDYVWSEGMSGWAAASIAMRQAPAGGPDPAAWQPMYMGLPPLGNAPGVVSSMVCGIIGTALSLPCCGVVSFITCLAGLPLGIVALVQAKKAKVLLAAYPDMYCGRGMAKAGYVLGIVAICLACLCMIGFLLYSIFVGTSFIPKLQHRNF